MYPDSYRRIHTYRLNMSDAAAPAPVKAKATPKKKVSKQKVAAAHPKFSAMVVTAIGSLKERKGSSKSAITKFIVANNKVGDNANKINANIKKALKAGVVSKELKQVSGTGASGSFKLGEKKAEKVKKPKAKKPAAKKPAAKKPKEKSTTPKKPKAKIAKTPKKAAAKKPAAPKKAKSPKKTAAKKVKTPKKVAKKPAAKKAAPKKK